MNRRQFNKRAALTLAVAGLGGSAFKCGSEKITIYTQTIVAFLKELAGLIPGQGALISKIVAAAEQFDAAYRRGDLTNASTFFNTLADNTNALAAAIGVNLSARIKVALAIVNSSIRLIAVLLKEQGMTQPAMVAGARASSAVEMVKAIGTIERLADEVAVNAAYQASKLPR